MGRLLPHQTIFANVELALTIGGISRNDRKERARKALEEVGLGDQLHKKPNQMSGGQIQRVAIARALVNDPEVLLADEPTGALDSETSIQVMELLKKVAENRLVVMVTHNSEPAKQYSTRIVKLRDGRITDDRNPFFPEETEGRTIRTESQPLCWSALHRGGKKRCLLITLYMAMILILLFILLLLVKDVFIIFHHFFLIFPVFHALNRGE